MFPNPATKYVNLISIENIESIKITNSIGQVVFSGQYNSPKIQIDVSGFPNSMYFVNVNGTEVRRFIKQ
jgi:hypothetical protein